MFRGKPLVTHYRWSKHFDSIDSEMPFYFQFQCVPVGDPHWDPCEVSHVAWCSPIPFFEHQSTI